MAKDIVFTLDVMMFLCSVLLKFFLGEELSDTETLRDMLLETTNMIVGSAKVLAQEQVKNSFTIPAPHFFDHNQFTPTTDENYAFAVGEGEVTIATKAL